MYLLTITVNLTVILYIPCNLQEIYYNDGTLENISKVKWTFGYMFNFFKFAQKCSFYKMTAESYLDVILYPQKPNQTHAEWFW